MSQFDQIYRHYYLKSRNLNRFDMFLSFCYIKLFFYQLFEWICTDEDFLFIFICIFLYLNHTLLLFSCHFINDSNLKKSVKL